MLIKWVSAAQWFSVPITGGTNNCKLTGGTGKFESLQGAVTIAVSAIKSNYDVIGQGVGHKKGNVQDRQNELRHPTEFGV